MSKRADKLSVKYHKEKDIFAKELSNFAPTLEKFIVLNGDWTVKGFVDVFGNVYTISQDTKVISKLLELHLFPHFLGFADSIGCSLELARYQNYYPDMTFINKKNSEIKFAVDLKTTYTNEKRPGFCNGFTLGSHGEYFINRESAKNIQYPYNEYCGHFCLGIIYSRAILTAGFETRGYSVSELESIPSVINGFTFFAAEKWKIASDKSGSGNTSNIGGIKNIADILSGNGVFAKAGEEVFDDYWTNFGKIQIETKDGERKKMNTFDEYIAYRNLSADIKNVTSQSRSSKVKPQ
ncbi:MAG: EcoRV family type II restriction endonuclease [Oscillospiraceae bacterium]|nr:EcoRV family type II restriction endonuclease [Oscillospiraceae bacterium]